MSIRARLLLLAVVVTLLAALFVAMRFVEERGLGIASVSQQLPVVAESISDALVEKVQGTEQLHFGLSRARDLDTSDRAACSTFLSRVREKYPQYTGILTILPDGKLFCDSLNTGRELDVSDRIYFQQARVAVDGISMQPAFGRLTQLAVLQIAYPVRDAQGDLKFVLLASLNLKQLAQASLKNSLLPGAEVMLVDRNGLVLAVSGGQAPQRQAGSSIAGTGLQRFSLGTASRRTAEFMNSDGTTEVWAAPYPSQLSETGVHVLVGYPKELLVAAANRRLVEALAVLAAAAMLTFLGVWIFAELAIRRPIARIAEMVTRLGKNERDARIPEPHPRGELGVLMQTLNQSAQAQALQHAAVDGLNARLRDAQRLESIGQLTGGIAHDFNNLLTVILGNAEVLQEQLAGNPRLAAMAAMVLDAAERGAELTQRLLAFARKQALQPRSVDVNDLVEAMRALVHRTLGEHIDIRFSRGPELWPALVDPAQLDNALLNLCLNSRDAMPEGGMLTIETANATLTAEYAQERADVRAGDYVMLAVSDTGTGIDPEIQARVFEPFFTTKEQGKGTGLGMAMIYGFVKQSGGHVTLYSEVGRGTTVRLYLPRALAASGPARQDMAGTAAPGGSETILVVEDDVQVRNFACGQLQSLGYKVIEADHPARALEIIRGDVEIDLLFTDVVMPGMSGRELVDEVRKVHPALKVLYTSGYAENALVHHGRLVEGVHLLSKPYRREALALKIRAALGSAQTAVAIAESNISSP